MTAQPDNSVKSLAPRTTTALCTLLVMVVCVLFFALFPRWLVQTLGLENPWTSYAYLYGNGLVVFVIGLVVILRSRSCVLGRGWDSVWFAVLLAGFAFFALLHAGWIWLALKVPFRGG